MGASLELFNKLKEDISMQVPFSVLKKRYPLMTKSLYKKLSGQKRIFRFNLEDDAIKTLVSDGLSQGSDEEDLGEEAKSFIVGSLFGDSHIEPIVENKHKKTYLLKVTHCWAQIGYIKLAYEVLKPYSSALTIKSPKKGLKIYNIQLTTIASKRFWYYRDLYYPGDKKDIMSEKVYTLLDWKSFAYWVMDDGKSRGGKYCFSVSIGFQEHYTEERLEQMSSFLSKKLGIDLKWGKEKNCYILYVLSKDSETIKERLLPYILPDFHYKFKTDPQELGSYYRKFEWYGRWLDNRLHIEHPFLKEVSYKEYKASDNALLHKRYEKSLFSQVVAKGFPYIRLREEELLESWQGISLAPVKCSADYVLTCTPTVNRFPNHFMNHRYHCKKKNNRSPYEVYTDRKALKKTLSIQLQSGPDISNTNIRNALSTYSSSGLGVFNTGIARYLIENYSANKQVLDPCAGWGNRLCAAASLGFDYTCIEPSTKTVTALKDIRDKLYGFGVKSEIVIKKSIAEDSSNYIEGFYGCSITSPPYFNLEEYSNEDTQSYKRYTVYPDWCEKFLYPMVMNVYRSLCRGGYFIINVGNVKGFDLVQSTESACLSSAFVMVRKYSLRPYKRPGMSSLWSEPVMVFRKD